MKKRPLFYFILLSFWLLNIVSILSVTNFAYQKSEKLQNKVFENNLNHQLNIFKSAYFRGMGADRTRKVYISFV